MAGIDNSKHHSIEKETGEEKAAGEDKFHQDPKSAYKEHADLEKQIKQTVNNWQDALGHFVHPTESDTKRQVESQSKFAQVYYKASVGKIVESVTQIATDGIKFVGQQMDAARKHDVDLALKNANPLKPVGEVIGSVPKIAQAMSEVKAHDVIEQAKKPEGLGSILGGILFAVTQFELPFGNKAKAAGELKALGGAKEISNVSHLEEQAHNQFAFLKTASHVEPMHGHPVKMTLNSGREIDAIETKLADGSIQRKFRDMKAGKEVEITQTKSVDKTVTEWEGNKVTQYKADKKVHERADGSVETTYKDGRKVLVKADGTTKTSFEKPIASGPGERIPEEGEPAQPFVPKMPSEAEIGRDLEKDGLVKLAKNGRYEQTENNCWDIAARLAKRFGYEMPDDKPGILKLAELHLGRKAGFRPNLKMPKDGGYLIIREDPTSLSEPMHITFACQGQEYNFGVTKADNQQIVLKIPVAKQHK
ncbi:MAG: hypothetical protein K2Y22_01620 [Candidatus Obscuribacterales bacterium]|nr:hypothetical protein [Candidatus Obscuribacterales bacterium]